MSLNIRHLTNGKLEVFTVSNTGTEPPTFEIFHSRDDIDKSLRDDVPVGKALYCGPDSARMFGVLDLFYPNHPNCGLADLKPHNVKRCIAESCKYAPDGNWEQCQYFHKS